MDYAERGRRPRREGNRQGIPPLHARLRDPRRGERFDRQQPLHLGDRSARTAPATTCMAFPHFCVSIALVENGEPTHGGDLRPAAQRPVHRQPRQRRHAQRAQASASPTARTWTARCSSPASRRANAQRVSAQLKCIDSPAAGSRGHPPHRFGRAGPGLCRLRPRRRVLRGRREAVGHRRRRVAGARSRRQGLRFPRPHHRPDGQPRTGGPPARQPATRKICDVLQQKIVNTGYAAAFD